MKSQSFLVLAAAAAIAVAVSALTGCGRSVVATDVEWIQNRMTVEEVQNILGEPDEIKDSYMGIDSKRGNFIYFGGPVHIYVGKKVRIWVKMSEGRVYMWGWTSKEQVNGQWQGVIKGGD